MQDFFSILPFLIFLASVGFLILIAASTFLIHDLNEMRREHLEGVPSIWYRRSRVRSSLKWMGYGLLVVVLAFGWAIIQFLPHNTAILSMMSAGFVVMSINIVISISKLVHDFRSLQWERREGFPSIWHRRPKILRRIGWIFFWCGPLLEFAYVECALLARYILHLSFPENTAPLIIIPGVCFLFAVACYSYAILLEVLNRRTY